MRTQRHVPILSGIFDLVVVLSLFLFWSPESGFWWWMRNGLLTLFLYMGIGSLKRGFFASDTEIARMVAGEYNAKDIGSEAGTAKKGNYLSRHWHGELSLPVSFWINYTALSVIYFVIGKVMESNKVGDSVGIPFMLILLPIIIWQCVGTWRSASNRGRFWGVAVKGCIAIGILETVAGYAILIT